MPTARHDPTTDTAEFRILGHENGRHGAAGSRVPAGAETAVLAHESAREPHADRDPVRRLIDAMRKFEALHVAWSAARVAAARAERRAEATRTRRRSRDGRACAAEVVAARAEARRLRREVDRLFEEMSMLAVEAAAAAEAAARKAH